MDDVQDDRHRPSGNESDSGLPAVRSSTTWGRMWRPFWALPLAVVAVALVVGVLLPEWERGAVDDLPFVFQGGADGARSVLGTIAGAMISVTGLVFSITMVVVQLASSQFSPRVLGDFLSSRVTQATLGVFTATFVYALTVLRSVEGTSDTESFVPQLSITLAFLLVLGSVVMFLAFIHHITTAIKVSSIVSHLGEDTMDVIGRYFPPGDRGAPQQPEWEPPTSAPHQIDAVEHGYVAEIALRRLLDWAVEHDAVVQVLLPVGRFVTEGSPALRIWPAPPEDEADELRRTVVVEQDRVMHQDPGFGVRKLVDIAERALSPGINDPTTASEVLDELHRILRALVARRDLPDVVERDGTVRLVHRPQRVAELVDLALEEVLHYGEESPQIPRRVLSICRAVRPAALPEHVPALDRWERVARRMADQLEVEA